MTSDNPLASSLTNGANGSVTTGDRSPVVLCHVASWHMDCADIAKSEGKTAIADRHYMIAFGLLKEARAITGATA